MHVSRTKVVTRMRLALALVALAAAIATAAALATAPGENGLIVFTGEVGKHTQLFTIEPDGSNLRQITHFRDGSDASNANWSPDGKRIVFDRGFETHGGIYVMNADGSGLRSLTPDTRKRHFEGNPTFTPDGKRIIYNKEICVTDNDCHAALWTKSPNGGGARRITPVLPSGQGGYRGHPQFSPDGKRIVYAKNMGDNAAVFVMNANGRGERQLTRFSMGVDDRVDWSPNGSLILFSDKTGRVDVYTIRPNGTGLKQLTRSSSGNYSAKSWSPDGKQIMLVVDRPGLSHASLFVMNADGTGLRQLTRTVNVHGGSWGTHP